MIGSKIKHVIWPLKMFVLGNDLTAGDATLTSCLHTQLSFFLTEDRFILATDLHI